jgi:hypothetical protein
MKLSRAEVRTEHSVSYLRQLCRHWSHQYTVEFDATPGKDTHGKITLPEAYVTLMSGPAALSVYLEVADPAHQEHMEEVVAEHLQRFGFRETLVFHWLRS